MTLPRMRTIPEAIAEIKTDDPHCSLTVYALRSMVKREAIPCIRCGQKILIDLDVLCAYLKNPAPAPPEPIHGKIRPISERRA